jgi:sec-independent protein translocase protein TatA
MQKISFPLILNFRGVNKMLGIGVWELTIVFAIVLVLFGGKRLPQVATGLGQAIRNFKAALKGDEETATKLLEKNLSESSNDKH